MAEVLGVVASGIAVVQIAGKATTTVLKLKQLWDQVKYVPEAILDLMEQLECLEPALSQLENRIEISQTLEGSSHTSSEQQSAIYCRKAFDKLSDLVEQLSAQINQNQRHKRTLERVKVVLKKEQLKQAEASLDSVIRMLTIAQQCHVTTMLERQPEITMKVVMATLQEWSIDNYKAAESRLVESKDREISDPAVSETKPLATQTRTRFGDGQRRRLTKWSEPGLFGALKFGFMSGGCSAAFQPPWWLAGTLRACEVEMNRSLAGWKSHLRVYSIRGSLSAPFLAAMRGDVEKLQRLFTSGKASPFDRDPNGWTVLHYAAVCTRTEVLKLFLELNLGDVAYERDVKNSQTVDLLATLYDAERRPPGLPLSGRAATFVDMFLAHLDISTDDHEAESSLCQCPATTSAYALKRLQPIVCPEHASTTLWSRIGKCRRSVPYSIAYLRYLLEPDWSRDPRQVCQGYAPQYPLVHSVALAYSESSFWPKDGEHAANDAFVLEILRHSQDLHSLERDEADKSFMTPFLALVNQFILWAPDWYGRVEAQLLGLQTSMLEWLTVLARAGVDLLEYGRCESSFLKNKKRRAKRSYRSNESNLDFKPTIKIRLVGILYGPKAEDWRLCWNEETDEYVGDFWDLVERGSSSIMPGSWDESDQDSDQDSDLDTDEYWDQDSDEEWDEDSTI